MAETGDWVTPRLYGRPWFEKPILYYWAAAAAFRAFGVSEFSARLPSALAALVAALALAWAAWRLYGRETAWALLLIFPTCVGVFGFARAATTDMLFSASLTVAIVAALRALWSATPGTPQPARLPAEGPILPVALFGAGLGLATLAKGPAAIVLAGGSVALWALVPPVRDRWRQALRLAHPAAILSFCALALPWYVLCALRNPGFAEEFLLVQNVERYLIPVFQHVQPVWFFVPVLLLGLVPWTALLAGVALEGLRRMREGNWKDSPGLFLACWVIFPVAFFSFSKSKLPGYVLPALPPLVLLLARSLVLVIAPCNARRPPGTAPAHPLPSAATEFFGGTGHKSRITSHSSLITRRSSLPPSRWLPVAVGATWVVVALSAGHWLKRLPAGWEAEPHGRIFLWVAIILVAGLVIASLGLLEKPWSAVIVSAALTTLLALEINRQFIPQLDPFFSSRQAALAFVRRSGLPAEQRCRDVAAYRLKRDWRYGLSFYLRRELSEWAPQESGEAQSICVFTSATGLREMERLGTKLAVLSQASPQALLVRVEQSR